MFTSKYVILDNQILIRRGYYYCDEIIQPISSYCVLLTRKKYKINTIENLKEIPRDQYYKELLNQSLLTYKKESKYNKAEKYLDVKRRIIEFCNKEIKKKWAENNRRVFNHA